MSDLEHISVALASWADEYQREATRMQHERRTNPPPEDLDSEAIDELDEVITW